MPGHRAVNALRVYLTAFIPLFELTRNRHSVGVVSDPQDREKNHELEIGEVLAWRLSHGRS